MASASTTPASRELVSFLTVLVESSLSSSLYPTGLFFSERLYALIPDSEHSIHLYGRSLWKSGEPRSAMHVLKPVVFLPQDKELLVSMERGNGARGRAKGRGRGMDVVPEKKGSVRCAWVYAMCCNEVGRPREGQEVLALTLEAKERGLEMITEDLPVLPDPLSTLQEAAMHCTLGKLALKTNQMERAAGYFTKALRKNRWCWEAWEGLCATGIAPEVDSIFGTRQPNAIPSIPQPPLTATTSSFTFNQPNPLTNGSTSTHSTIDTASMGVEGGFFTPAEGVRQGPHVGGRLFAPPGVEGAKGKSNVQRVVVDMSIDDSTMPFEPSFLYNMPGRQQRNPMVQPIQPRPLSDFAHMAGTGMKPSTSSSSAISNPASDRPASSFVTYNGMTYEYHGSGPLPNNLFTPSALYSVSSGSSAASGGGMGGPASNSTSTSASSSRNPGLKRTRTGGAGTSTELSEASGAGRAADSSVATRSRRTGTKANPSDVGTRKSSRTTAATGTSENNKNGIGRATRTGKEKVPSGLASGTNDLREKKRAKQGGSPSPLLSDPESGVSGISALSPNSIASSPSSHTTDLQHPPLPHGKMLPDSALHASQLAWIQAEEWLWTVVRGFAKAVRAMSRFECKEVVDSVVTLPNEQKRGWRALCLLARAKFETLEYTMAEGLFSKARIASPYLTQYMDIYSTLLWHLHRPIPLSALAQDLQSISPQSPQAWIATGNIFSHLENHAAALRCFKRASQVDDGCVYAFTLSGHECVALEEWENAIGFYREAVRRDRRHYNAWFGLGQAYMSTGNNRMAEYHFRQAAALNPSNAMLVCGVGMVLERLSRNSEALGMYQVACDLAPGSAAVKFKRARMLFKVKRYDDALKDLIDLKDQAPDEFNVQFQLGRLYLKVSYTHQKTFPHKAKEEKTLGIRHLTFAQELNPMQTGKIRELIDSGGAGGDDEDDEWNSDEDGGDEMDES